VRDLNRLSSCGLLVIILLTFADPAAVNVGTVQVSLTGPNEGNIAVDEATIFPMAFSRASRWQDGLILPENEK
jgi:hypothetical protein